MLTLIFLGLPHMDSYQGEHVPARVHAAGKPKDPTKPEGEKYDGKVQVTEAGAAYLLSTFPTAWKKDEPAPKASKAEPKAEPAKKDSAAS
jgi:hypothetical protein